VSRFRPELGSRDSCADQGVGGGFGTCDMTKPHQMLAVVGVATPEVLGEL
jgi:hypothetical protein